MIFIKSLYFENYEDFSDEIANTYEQIKAYDDLDSVEIIAKYKEAKEIIRELVNVGYGIAFITELADPNWDNYDDEFIISLMDDEIWCEPFKRDNGYISSEACICFVMSDCNAKVIKHIETEHIFEVDMGEEYSEHYDNYPSCCECKCQDCDCEDDYTNKEDEEIKDDKEDICCDEDMHGFTISKCDGNSSVSYSYYTSDELSKADIKELIKNFNI